MSLQIMMSEMNFLKFKNQQVNNIFLRINGKYDILIQLVIQLEWHHCTKFCNKNLDIFRMDLEDIMLSEISQTRKGKYCMISLICRIYKTKQMNKQNRNRLIDTENELLVARGKGDGRVRQNRWRGLRGTNFQL